MTTTGGHSSLRPFRPAVTDEAVEDLRRRLAASIRAFLRSFRA